MADTGDAQQKSAKAKSDALSLAEQAEAEAAEAEALAAAARARARAIQLRREAEAQAEAEAESDGDANADVDAGITASDEAEVTDEATEAPETAESAEPEPEPAEAEPAEAQSPEAQSPEAEPARRRLRVPSVSLALSTAAAVAIVGLLGASGWMAWQHHQVVKEQHRAAAFIATARQGVINLTSLDFNKAKEDVQRVLDGATGEFKDDFQKRAEDFASVVKDSKAVTEGSVAATAVESMNNDSAVILVLATERVTNIAGAKDQPRTFRFRVSVVHDSDDLKVSKVEFVL
jgi:Mce-associated membrane protein